MRSLSGCSLAPLVVVVVVSAVLGLVAVGVAPGNDDGATSLLILAAAL